MPKSGNNLKHKKTTTEEVSTFRSRLNDRLNDSFNELNKEKDEPEPEISQGDHPSLKKIILTSDSAFVKDLKIKIESVKGTEEEKLFLECLEILLLLEMEQDDSKRILNDEEQAKLDEARRLKGV